jgi:phage terminase large subunit
MPYRWGKDWMPHDARAKQKTSGGRSAEEIVKALGRDVEIVPNIDVESGIKWVRDVFPRLWVNQTTCVDWLNKLKRYKRHKSPDGARSGEPVHDDASHGADALRYLAIVSEKLTNSAPGKLQPIRYSTAGVV